MKKKNAFTLIELIATIAIIAIISLVATVTYNKIRKDILEHQYLNLKSLIETAAIKYSSKNGYSSFFVQDLINDGLVETDDEEYVYDPRDESPLNCHIVHVSVETNGMLTAVMSDESYEDNGMCKTSSVKVYEANLKMSAKIEGTNVTYPVNSMNTGTNAPYIFNGWTRFNLDITADPSDITATDNIKEGKYVWNNNPNRTTIEPTRTITTNEYGVYNDYYYLDLYTKSGSRYNAKMLYKFDNEKPTIYKDEQGNSRIKLVNQNDENVWMQSKTIFIYASDKNGSGLSRIYVGREKCNLMLTNTSMGQPAQPTFIQTYEVMIETGQGTENYHVCVMDKAGNIAESSMSIKKIDITPPSCGDTIPTIADNDWTKNDRTITVKCTDAHYITEDGVERHLDGSGCVDSQLTNTYTTTTRRASVTFKDQVGWETTCEYNVLVDKTPPTCSTAEGASTEWTKENRTISQYCTDAHSGCPETPVTQTFTSTKKTDTITVSDNVGNTTNCTVNVYVDKTPPRLDPAPAATSSSFYPSSCRSQLNYTWVDDDSGFAEGTYDVYYKGSGESDYSLKVSGIHTIVNPIPKFWYLSEQESASYLSKYCKLGNYKFILTGKDNVGNETSPTTYEYSVVSPPPDPPTPPTPEPPDGGCNGRFSYVAYDPSQCNDTAHGGSGYYMEIAEDTMRCPFYGCSEDTELGTFNVTYIGPDENDIDKVRSYVTDVLTPSNPSLQNNYMYKYGVSGDVYYYYTCSSGGINQNITCSTSSQYPIYYYIKNSECTHTTNEVTESGHTGFKTTCPVHKRQCIKFNNGSEFMAHYGGGYHLNCCKSASSDSHCRWYDD